MQLTDAARGPLVKKKIQRFTADIVEKYGSVKPSVKVKGGNLRHRHQPHASSLCLPYIAAIRYLHMGSESPLYRFWRGRCKDEP